MASNSVYNKRLKQLNIASSGSSGSFGSTVSNKTSSSSVYNTRAAMLGMATKDEPESEKKRNLVDSLRESTTKAQERKKERQDTRKKAYETRLSILQEREDFDELAKKGAEKANRKIGLGNKVQQSINNTEAMNEYLRSTGVPNKFINRGYNQNPYEYMTPQQLSTYNAFIGLGDRAGARMYLQSIENEINQKAVEKATLLNNAKDIKKADAAIMAADAGAQRAFTGAKQLGESDAISPSYQEMLFENVRPQMDKSTGVVADVANSVGFMLPAVAVSSLAGGAGFTGAGAKALSAALFGAASGGSAYNDVLRSNPDVDKFDAKVYSIVNGALEGGLQYALGGIGKLGGKAGLTKLVGKAGVNAALAKKLLNVSKAAANTPEVQRLVRTLTAAGQYGSGMADEAVEEWLQAVFDPIIRNYVLDENNEVQLFGEEQLYSAMLGALGAAVMNLPDTVSNYKNADATLNKAIIRNAIKDAKAKKGTTSSQNIPELTEEELAAYGNDPDIAELATEIARLEEELPNRKKHQQDKAQKHINDLKKRLANLVERKAKNQEAAPEESNVPLPPPAPVEENAEAAPTGYGSLRNYGQQQGEATPAGAAGADLFTRGVGVARPNTPGGDLINAGVKRGVPGGMSDEDIESIIRDLHNSNPANAQAQGQPSTRGMRPGDARRQNVQQGRAQQQARQQAVETFRNDVAEGISYRKGMDPEEYDQFIRNAEANFRVRARQAGMSEEEIEAEVAAQRATLPKRAVKKTPDQYEDMPPMSAEEEQVAGESINKTSEEEQRLAELESQQQQLLEQFEQQNERIRQQNEQIAQLTGQSVPEATEAVTETKEATAAEEESFEDEKYTPAELVEKYRSDMKEARTMYRKNMSADNYEQYIYNLTNSFRNDAEEAGMSSKDIEKEIARQGGPTKVMRESGQVTDEDIDEALGTKEETPQPVKNNMAKIVNVAEAAANEEMGVDEAYDEIANLLNERDAQNEAAGQPEKPEVKVADGRIEVLFPGYPGQEATGKLKEAGFKWDGDAGVWFGGENASNRAVVEEVTGVKLTEDEFVPQVKRIPKEKTAKGDRTHDFVVALAERLHQRDYLNSFGYESMQEEGYQQGKNIRVNSDLIGTDEEANAMGHEAAHLAARSDAKLASDILDLMRSIGRNVDALVDEKRNTYLEKGVSVPEGVDEKTYFEEEVAASFIGEICGKNPELLNNIAAKQPGIVKRIRDFLKNLANTLTGKDRDTCNTAIKRLNSALNKQRDSEYLELAKEPEQNRTRLSDMVKEAANDNGFDTNVFHGTTIFGWTKPDISFANDGATFFASDDVNVASTYTHGNSYREIGTDPKKYVELLNIGKEMHDWAEKKLPGWGDIFPVDGGILQAEDFGVPDAEAAITAWGMRQWEQLQYYFDRTRSTGELSDDAFQVAFSKWLNSSEGKALDNELGSYYRRYESVMDSIRDEPVSAEEKKLVIKHKRLEKKLHDSWEKRGDILRSLVPEFTDKEYKDKIDSSLDNAYSASIWGEAGGKDKFTTFIDWALRDKGFDFRQRGITEEKFTERARNAWEKLIRNEEQSLTLSKKVDEAEYELERYRLAKREGVYGFYANTDDMYTLDAEGSTFAEIKNTALKRDGIDSSIPQTYNTKEVANLVKEAGYSGVIIKNLIDTATDFDQEARGIETYREPSTIYIFFKPDQQVRSADPITYDDNGNVIPISERFNPDSKDIRWSLSEEAEPRRYSISKPTVPSSTFTPNKSGETPVENMIPEVRDIWESLPDSVKKYMQKPLSDINGEAWKNIMKKGGVDAVSGTLLKAKNWNAPQLEMAVEVGKYLADNGETDRAADIFTKVAAQQTDFGRAIKYLQTLQMYMPKVASAITHSIANDLGVELSKEEQDNIKLCDRIIEQGFISNSVMNKATGDFKEWLNDARDYVDRGLLDPSTAAYAAAMTLVVDKTPPTARQKFRALQRISLLSNPKTHFRNILGNLAEQTGAIMSRPVADMVDRALSKVTGRRTFGSGGLSAVANSFASSIDQVVMDAKLNTNTIDNKFDEGDINSGLKGLVRQKTFNEHTNSEIRNTLNKAANGVDKAISLGLEMGDAPYLISSYDAALAQVMNANPELLVDGEATDEMKEMAWDVSQRRTFRDRNDVVKSLNKIRDALGIGGDTIAPYVTTPVNVVLTAIQYSPIAFGEAFCKALIGDNSLNAKLKRGENIMKTQRQIAELVGRGALGTALMLVGSLLRAAGKITGDDDDIDSQKEKNWNKAVGRMGSSIKVGDTYIDPSSLQSLSTPIMAGAAAYESKNDDEDGTDWGGIFGAAAKASMKMGNTMLEMPVLQGVADLLGGNYDDGELLAGALSLAGNAVTQLVPFGSVLKQGAKAVDPYSRVQSEINAGPVERVAKSTVNNLRSMTPWGRKKLSERYDVLGNPIKNDASDNTAERLYNSFINPFNTSKENANDVTGEIDRLYASLQDTAVLPSAAGNSISYGGEKYKFTSADKQEYQRVEGESNAEILSKLVNSDAYDRLSDEEKAKVLSSVYDYSANKAKANYLKKQGVDYESDAKWMDSIDEIVKTGVDVGDAMVYRYELNNIKGSDNQVFYIDSLPLNSDQKDTIDEAFVDKYRSSYIDEDRDYTNADTLALSMTSDSGREKYNNRFSHSWRGVSGNYYDAMTGEEFGHFYDAYNSASKADDRVAAIKKMLMEMYGYNESYAYTMAYDFRKYYAAKYD